MVIRCSLSAPESTIHGNFRITLNCTSQAQVFGNKLLEDKTTLLKINMVLPCIKNL